MVSLVPVSGLDDAQVDLFARWAAVFAESGRHVFGSDHTAWGVDELRELERAESRRRLGVAAVDDRGVVVGAAGVAMPLRDNLGLAVLTLAVVPARRREGVGAALLAWAEGTAAAHGRSVLLAETEWPVGGRDESGEGFAVRRGFAPAQTVLRSTLALPADPALLEPLAAGGGTSGADGTSGAAGTRGTGYELETSWDGIPEQWLEGHAELRRRMSTDVPLGDLRLEEERWDAERVRGEYLRTTAMGRRIVDTVARDTRSGRLVGYTQVQVSRETPRLAYQQDTLVLREHRGHRLGLRLKAANTLAVMEGLPGVTAIRTWNADDNGPMLAVNRAIGYAPDAVLREWQKVLG
jgi:GNAT superfamily N-acetyltransferase